MKEKTAIGQLIEYCEEQSKLNNIVHPGLIMALTKAKQLEAVNEQQIKDGHFQGQRLYPITPKKISAEEYFNKNFEK